MSPVLYFLLFLGRKIIRIRIKFQFFTATFQSVNIIILKPYLETTREIHHALYYTVSLIDYVLVNLFFFTTKFYYRHTAFRHSRFQRNILDFGRFCNQPSICGKILGLFNFFPQVTRCESNKRL